MMTRPGRLLCAVLLGLGGPVGMMSCVRTVQAQEIPPEKGAPSSAVPLPPRSPVRDGVEADDIKAGLKTATDFRARLQAELEAARGDRGKLNKLLIETTSRSRQVEQQLITVEGRLKLLDQSASSLTASLARRRGVLAEVLAALLRMGRNPPPALLMRPDDALDAVRSAILLGALLPELRVEAETLAADLSELVRVRQELTQAQETLRSLRAALEEDHKRLAALMGERQRQQAAEHPLSPEEKARAMSLARSTGDVHDLVSRLETEVPSAVRAADAAQATTQGQEGPGVEGQGAAPPGSQVLASVEPKPDLTALKDPGRLSPAIAFVNAKGLLPLPVAGVKLRDFGASDGVGSREKGSTFATRPGALVSAPADGWVVYAGPFRSYGQLLIINAGGGYHILLAGMERITVELGQFVLAGEPVAVMGGPSKTTGPDTASGQPQLYVEFRKDGNSIDPAPWWAATDSRKVRG